LIKKLLRSHAKSSLTFCDYGSCILWWCSCLESITMCILKMTKRGRSLPVQE
jgi:hypothetical protein